MRNNVEVIRKVYQAIGNKDAEAIVALSDPDIEVRQSEELPWGGVYKGLEQSIGFFHRVSGALDSVVTPEKMIDAGEHVAVVGRTEGTVKGNGQAFSVPLVHLWRLKGGRVASLLVLLDNPGMSAVLLGVSY